MHTVVESQPYLRKAEALFLRRREGRSRYCRSKESRDRRGHAGNWRLSQFRVGRGAMGKRGGARVIYIYRNEQFPAFLITVFAKNEMDNLSKAERNELKKRPNGIFETYGVKS